MEMMPQKHEERREQFRVRQVKPTADELKREIETWVREIPITSESCYDRSQFPYLDTFRDRTIDVSQPLAAILEIAYDGSSELQHSRRELIKAISITRKEEEHLAEDLQILAALRNKASIAGPLIGTASELVSECSQSGTLDEIPALGHPPALRVRDKEPPKGRRRPQIPVSLGV